MTQNKRVLHLTLERKWFDLIAQGKKTSEYREYKDHWKSRLVSAGKGFRKFDEVRFVNGYGSDRPFMRVEFVDTRLHIGHRCRPQNGEIMEPYKHYFVIYLGRILEIGNYDTE
jgi:hypothetical protein